MNTHLHIRGFMTPAELGQLTETVRKNAGMATGTLGRGGLGPRYRVIDGNQIRSQMDEIETYGERRIRPVVERFARQQLKVIDSPRRSMRIQFYEKRDHNFRWHFDGHSYVALLTLRNTNNGQTQIMPPGLSSLLRFVPHPVYALRGVFDSVPYHAITAQAGDLLVMAGSRVLHRGVTLEEEGERWLVVYAYEGIHKRPNPLQDMMARWLNY